MSEDIIIISKNVQRKIIFGNMENKQRVREKCIAEGFRIIYDGAKPLGLKKYSDNEFKLIAERVF